MPLSRSVTAAQRFLWRRPGDPGLRSWALRDRWQHLSRLVSWASVCWWWLAPKVLRLLLHGATCHPHLAPQVDMPRARRLMGVSLHWMPRLLVCTLLASLLATSGCQSGTGTALSWRGLVKIGLALPFSRYDASTAENALHGARLAIDETNAAGGIKGIRLELVALDDRNSPEVAAQNAREFAVDPAVVTVLAHLNSDSGALAASEYASRALPVVGLGITWRGFRVAGTPYAISLAPDDKAWGELLARGMAVLGVRNVQILAADTIGARSQAEAVARQLQDSGVSVADMGILPASSLAFPLSAYSISDTAQTAFVFCGPFAQAGSVAMSLLRDSNHSLFVALGDASALGFSRLVGDSAGRVYYVTQTNDGVPYQASGFADRYRARFSAEPHIYASLVYDGIGYLTDVARRVDRDSGRVTRELVAKEVLGHALYQGVTGSLAWDGDGRRIGATLALMKLTGSGGSAAQIATWAD